MQYVEKLIADTLEGKQRLTDQQDCKYHLYLDEDGNLSGEAYRLIAKMFKKGAINIFHSVEPDRIVGDHVSPAIYYHLLFKSDLVSRDMRTHWTKFYLNMDNPVVRDVVQRIREKWKENISVS